MQVLFKFPLTTIILYCVISLERFSGNNAKKAGTLLICIQQDATSYL